MDFLTEQTWSPYAVGIIIGVLNCIAIVVSDKFIGCSTAFSRSSGMLEKLVRGKPVFQKPYYKKFTPEIDWEWMLVAGVAVGAFAAAWLSGSLQAAFVPDLWAKTFGSSAPLRFLAACAGGILVGIGARGVSSARKIHFK